MTILANEVHKQTTKQTTIVVSGVKMVLLAENSNLYVYRFFAAASPTLYYRFESKFYVNFRQSEVFLNYNIHHTS